MSGPRVTLFVSGQKLVLGDKPSSSASATINYVEGDTLPSLSFNVGTSMPTTAYSAIVLRVLREDGERLTKTRIVDDAPNGKFHFDWAPGDLVRGKHEAEVEFTELGGKVLTVPSSGSIILDVRRDVA